MNLIIGSHVGFNAKTQLLGSVEEALSYNANTFMIYTGSTQSTLRSKIDPLITEKAWKLMEENNIKKEDIIVHAPYIINLGNREDEEKYMFYVNFFAQELQRVKELGLDKLFYILEVRLDVVEKKLLKIFLMDLIWFLIKLVKLLFYLNIWLVKGMKLELVLMN